MRVLFRRLEVSSERSGDVCSENAPMHFYIDEQDVHVEHYAECRMQEKAQGSRLKGLS